jgi:adenylate cyclase
VTKVAAGLFMDYDKLTPAYRAAQRDRVEALRKQIAARKSCVTNGRVIPGHSDQLLGEARRLKIAVMFLDICGFSTRPAESEGEQDMLVRVLHLYFTEMVRVAEEYGGTVEKNTGDGLMAYFEDGGGEPPESAVKRAVSCALTQFFVTENVLNPIFRSSGVEPLAFRIGIDYGNVSIEDTYFRFRTRSQCTGWLEQPNSLHASPFVEALHPHLLLFSLE